MVQKSNKIGPSLCQVLRNPTDQDDDNESKHIFSFKIDDFSSNSQGMIQERARTRQVHQTSCMRNPARRLLCTVPSCVDTKGVTLLLQRGLLHFRRRRSMEMSEKGR